MKKWAVPAYIRGFDSFKPPMSRFCLWKAALFTRFWSLHLPLLAWLTRFWSRNFSQGDLIYEVLISGKTIYIYYIYNVYTRFWSRLRHSDGLLFARSWSHSVRFRPAPMHEVLISLLAWRRELIHEVCISPRCAEPPKRDQNLVNRLPEWHWPRKYPFGGRGERSKPRKSPKRDQNLVNDTAFHKQNRLIGGLEESKPRE